MQMISRLSQTRMLILSGTVLVICGLAMGRVTAGFNGEILDRLVTSEAALARLAEMTPGERTAHFWSTTLIDSVLPLAYMALFAGLLIRFAPGFKSLAPWPPILGGLADYSENLVQAIALGGGPASALALKDIVTPLKFGLLALSLTLILAFLAYACIKKLIGKET